MGLLKFFCFSEFCTFLRFLRVSDSRGVLFFWLLWMTSSCLFFFSELSRESNSRVFYGLPVYFLWFASF